MVGVRGGHYLSPSEYVKHGLMPHNPALRLVAAVSGVSPRHVFCPTFLCDVCLDRDIGCHPPETLIMMSRCQSVEPLQTPFSH